MDRYYKETVFPVLTPLALDPGRPFPHISNLSMNLAVVLNEPAAAGRRQKHFARAESAGSACRSWCACPALARAAARPVRVRKFVWIEQV